MKKDIIKQPNIIIQAAQDYTTVEKNILTHVLEELDPQWNVDIKQYQNLSFHIPTTLIAKNNNDYKQLHEALDILLHKSITIEDSKNRYYKIMPFSSIIYDRRKNKEFVIFNMNNEVIKYYVELKHGFTQTYTRTMLNLETAYSKRIYELLSRYQHEKQWTVSIQEFRRLLGIERKYKDFPDLRNKILLPAHEEINRISNLSYTYDFIKEGREYTEIEFIINDKATAAIKQLETQPPSKQEEAFLNALAEYTFDLKHKQEIKKSPELKTLFMITHIKIKTGDIIIKRTKEAYMLTTLGLIKTKL